jgi:hypothetical protein
MIPFGNFQAKPSIRTDFLQPYRSAPKSKIRNLTPEINYPHPNKKNPAVARRVRLTRFAPEA